MMEAESILARRYAHAFLSLWNTSYSAENIMALKHALDYFNTHRPLCSLLKVPLITPDKKQEALSDLLIHQFQLPSLFNELIALLVQHKRAFLLPAVLHALYHLYQERAGVMMVTIASSFPLNEMQKSRLQAYMERVIGLQLLYTYTIDSQSIAGIRVYSDTILWEYSIAKQLRALQYSMNEEIG